MSDFAYGPSELGSDLGVSRETLDQLRWYDALLIDRAKQMNLIGPGTVEDRWRRHYLDSAQLYPLFPPDAQRVADIGSGAGFPGLVLAALGHERDIHVELFESNGKKANFLREVVELWRAEEGHTKPKVSIRNMRAEDYSGEKFDLVTARAVAPLSKLLGFAQPLLKKGGKCLFLKGQHIDAELTEAAKSWKIRHTRHISRSDSAGAILEIEDFRRV